ncbi:MAG: RNA polymerase sigma factor [Byssovorax sp.]
MSDRAAIEAALILARPRVIAALLRTFRELDTAEEGFQEASLRAIERWTDKGAPDDPAAWLVLVGRNAIFDARRKSKRNAGLDELPTEGPPAGGDSESLLASRLDDAEYRDDVLRLLFVCCHPELPPAQQIALALRVVCGLSVKEIARAFLVSESALEQRITRAKSRIGEAQVPFDAPAPEERRERLAAVAATVYLVFNEGYSATGGEAHIRLVLCEEAIRLARLLLGIFPGEPSILGLTALLVLQHARVAGRLDREGNIVLLDRQDRSRWDRSRIEEGVALLDAGMRLGRPDPYLVQAAIAALHAQARRAEDTDWAQIDLLYATLEQLRPSPVVTLNRAVAVAKARGATAALALIAPLEDRLGDYFHFHGVKGGLLAELGRNHEARRALERALELAKTPAEAAQIQLRLDEVRAAT